MVKITIKQGSIVNEVVDAIVNPSNSAGSMGGGVALAIKEIGGHEIEEEAMSMAPIHIGDAVMTTSALLPCANVIHASTMENPVEKTDQHKVKCATEAAIELADREELKTIAFPGMGTGVGGMDYEEAAEAMMQVIKNYEYKSLVEIKLIALKKELEEAWNKFN